MRPPQSWQNARVTLFLTLAVAAAWLLAALFGAQVWAIRFGGFVPAAVGADLGTGVPVWLAPLTATFVHADIVHLALNLIIFAFCGRAAEAVIGPVGMIMLYVAGAYAAAAVEWSLDPGQIVPMVGASGAISAVIGAYAILFGRNRVKVKSPALALWLNALWLLAAWVVLQIVVGLTVATAGLGVAIGAHIGGFVFGLALAYPLLLLRYRGA